MGIYEGLAYRRSNNISSRNVPFSKQYRLLLGRMLTSAMRIPVAFLALIMMAFFQGMLQASIFGEVGAENYSKHSAINNQKITGNFIGLAFLVGSDQFITCSFAQVLQIPIARPIFMREVSNRMYTATAYYMAQATASVLMFILYPIVSTLTAFYFFELEEHGFGAMLEWMFI